MASYFAKKWPNSGRGNPHSCALRCSVPPRLLPAQVAKTVCLVGKGIVYDTGGLGLKGKDGMCGIKADMGGGAALLGAFEVPHLTSRTRPASPAPSPLTPLGRKRCASLRLPLPTAPQRARRTSLPRASLLRTSRSPRSQAAVASGLEDTALHLCLCLAENAIGPSAFRHDDILCLLSGKTCEINNTDAEGRLVLADGVAHATARPPKLPGVVTQPDLVVDMATLTGAQLVATGKRHAAVVTNDEDVELAAVAAGKLSGDLVHPLPYCPEFYRKEFKSQVGDRPRGGWHGSQWPTGASAHRQLTTSVVLAVRLAMLTVCRAHRLQVADMKNSVKDRSNAQTSCAVHLPLPALISLRSSPRLVRESHPVSSPFTRHSSLLARRSSLLTHTAALPKPAAPPTSFRRTSTPSTPAAGSTLTWRAQHSSRIARPATALLLSSPSWVPARSSHRDALRRRQQVSRLLPLIDGRHWGATT